MLYLFSHYNLNHGLSIFFILFFIVCYEVINGFHDTANSVSTLIYTRAMSANLSVFISGIFNFLGVLLGGLTVAYAIVHLLPNDLLLSTDSKNVFAMIFSMLFATILWNLSTWYFCLPASSSHSLIGSIIGIGLTNALVNHSSIITALNIPQMMSILFSLIFSPIFGLIISGIFIFLLRYYIPDDKKKYFIHMTPSEYQKIDGKKNPPLLIRIALILSSIGVSYAHGANDGQKGIGLIMLVLIGIIPSSFLVNLHSSRSEIIDTKNVIYRLEKYYYSDNYTENTKINKKSIIKNSINICNPDDIINNLHKTKLLLKNILDYHSLTIKEKLQLRHFLLCISETIDHTIHFSSISDKEKNFLIYLKKDLLRTIEYAPLWIIFLVAISLSVGTMIGWKRIVITIGEKIGKKRMTYAQAMSAQMTTFFSIGLASYTGIPVSTTHILSSSIAGTMLIDGHGVQIKTVKNIILAWILTLPVSILLSGSLYWIILFCI